MCSSCFAGVRFVKGVKIINVKKTKCVNGDQRQFSFAYIFGYSGDASQYDCLASFLRIRRFFVVCTSFNLNKKNYTRLILNSQ